MFTAPLSAGLNSSLQCCSVLLQRHTSLCLQVDLETARSHTVTLRAQFSVRMEIKTAGIYLSLVTGSSANGLASLAKCLAVVIVVLCCNKSKDYVSPNVDPQNNLQSISCVSCLLSFHQLKLHQSLTSELRILHLKSNEFCRHITCAICYIA